MKKIILFIFMTIYPLISFWNFNLHIDWNIQDYKGNSCLNENQGISLMHKETTLGDRIPIFEDSRESLRSEAIGKFEVDLNDLKGRFEIKDYKLKFLNYEYPLEYYKSNFLINESWIYFFWLKLLCDKEKIIEDRLIKNANYEKTDSHEDYSYENPFKDVNPETFLNQLNFIVKEASWNQLNNLSITLIDSITKKLIYKRIGVSSPFSDYNTKQIPIFVQINNSYDILIQKEWYNSFSWNFIATSKNQSFNAVLSKIENSSINNSGTINTNSWNLNNDDSLIKNEQDVNLEGDNEGDLMEFNINWNLYFNNNKQEIINWNITFVNKLNSKIIYSVEIKTNIFYLNNFKNEHLGDYYYSIKNSKGENLSNWEISIRNAKDISIVIEKFKYWNILILIIALIFTSFLLINFKKKKIIKGEK